MLKHIFIIVIFTVFIISLCYSQIALETEIGAAFSGYNDVRIPGTKSNTKFSFTDELKSDPVLSYRFTLSYKITDRNELSLIYAPLHIKPQGSSNKEIRFQREVFPADTPLDGTYRFDSYRLQYRYFFANQKMIIKAVGVTAKIRDAEISLKSDTKTATKPNTGFVPIINFLLSFDLNEQFSISADGAGLWSPFGRAADILTSLDYKMNEKISLKAGYRILEGGSDGDEVYTFALINYLVLSVRVSF